MTCTRRALRSLVLAVTMMALLPASARAGTNWEDTAWSAWSPAGAATSTPAVTSWGSGRLDMFVRGQDNAIWQRTWNGAWSEWVSIGGAMTSAPAAVSWGPGRVDVFARGPDDALWTDAWTGSSWTGWRSLGGLLDSTPAVASWGTNRLDVFARGTDLALWHRAWDGTAWSGWESLGGHLLAAPAAVSWGPGRIDVVVTGGDRALWHVAWTGSAWSGWEPLGGNLTSAPTVASWGANRLDVLARGGDNAIWHLAWTGSTWVGWEPQGGLVDGDPQAYSWESDRIDVLVRGTDHAIWRKAWNGTVWSGWSWLGAAPYAVNLPEVPFIAQQYLLSCEEAALQMALGHNLINVSQLQELNDIGIDWRQAYTTSDGVLHWGDPYTNFVGDPNGSEVLLTGYGTYFSTISRIAAGYGAASGERVLSAGEGTAAQDVYNAVLGNHPAVVWVSFDWKFHPHGQWLAFDGRWVQYEGPVEHAVTIAGVNTGWVLVYNPWFGPQWIDKATFEAAYATYNNMAVILE